MGAAPAMLRMVVCGSVDDGKSTLVGRLLVGTGSVPDDVVEACRSRRPGSVIPPGEVDYSLVTDGLEAEREQGITIDVAHRQLDLPSGRRVLLADAPGHEQYTRNVAVAASGADVVLLLVDAVRGVRPQTSRHLTISAMLGLHDVILAVNKIDAVSDSHAIFERIAEEIRVIAARLGLPQPRVIPTSALRGDNVTVPSLATSWYSGSTVLEALEEVGNHTVEDRPWRFPVQWVIRSGGRRYLAGTILRSRLHLGERVIVSSSGAAATVTELIGPRGSTRALDRGEPGTLRLEPDLDAARGDLLTPAKATLAAADRFSLDVIWTGEAPLARGRRYWLLCGPIKVPATVTSVRYRLDIETGSQFAATTLALNDIGRVEVATERPVPLDPYEQCREMGGILLVDRVTADTVAAGMIRFALRRAATVSPTFFAVGRTAREALAGHRSVVVWFTGLSGAGKSTIADIVERELHGEGVRTYLLDGEGLRSGLSKDLGFTVSDRAENVRRAAEVARLMLDSGIVVLVCLVSPFRADRDGARDIVGNKNFVEVYVETPLEICAERDDKGLYARARSGLLPNLTGVGQDYEPPDQSDVVISGAGEAKQAAHVVAGVVRARIAINPRLLTE